VKGKGSILIVIVAAIFALAVMSFLIYGEIAQYRNLAADTIKQESELKQFEQRLSELQTLSRQGSSLMDYVNTCKVLMPDKPDESGLIAYIQGVAGNSSSVLLQIKFNERVKANNYITMPLTITFEGKYVDLVSFLKGLRGGSRAVRVDGINIANSDPGSTTIRADLTADAFCLGE
jgi:Tfp pilus assembly protein PilO